MKGLRKLLDTKVKPHFEEGGKLKRFWVVYDSLDTFAFVPDHVTKSGSHIRDGIDMKRTMMTVIIAMIPCLLFGTFNIGHQHYLMLGDITSADAWSMMFWEKMGIGAMRMLPLLAVSYGVGLGFEYLFAGLRGHAINEGFLVSGMLIPLVMPPDVPLWMVGVAVVFAVIIGKEVFGGTGMNIMNVALTARAFVFFAQPTFMSGNVWISGAKETAKSAMADGYTGASALGRLAETITDKSLEKVTEVEALISSEGLFSFDNCLWGIIPGSAGETSTIACLIGAAILLWTGIASWRVMLSFLAGGFAAALIFNGVGANVFMDVPPHHQLVMGGFMFGLVFMATDPVTAAQTATGKLIYGFFGGLLSIIIRVVNPAYPEGVMMAILFMNVMAPFIDHYVVQANVKRRMKRGAVAAA